MGGQSPSVGRRRVKAQIVLVVFSVVLCACGPSLEGLHQACSPNNARDEPKCAAGQTCIGWGGFDGVTRWTCEITCPRDEVSSISLSQQSCPEGLSCTCMNDGPCGVCM